MTALSDLQALADPQRATEMARYHKQSRAVLGVSNPLIEGLRREWRNDWDLSTRLEQARTLWDSDIFEARIAAAKLLTQARIRSDESTVWQELQRWVPMFDSWAIADHASGAIARRLTADPARLDIVETWTQHESFWVRRAALVCALPWARQRHPTAEESAARERILGWAAAYVPDREWFIQKAIGWWLRDLSKRDPARVEAFIAKHGDGMKPFARREALKHISKTAPRPG